MNFDGLKTLRKGVSEGKIVILPTNKSGRFTVMSISTYHLHMVHVEGDEEITLSDLKSNQRKLNGHLSIKIFGLGKD